MNYHTNDAFFISTHAIAWEIFEYIVEGTEETYGTVSKWAWNTASDIVVEVGAAWWMVLPAGSLIG